MNATALARLERAFLDYLRRTYPDRAWRIVRDEGSESDIQQRLDAAERSDTA